MTQAQMFAQFQAFQAWQLAQQGNKQPKAAAKKPAKQAKTDPLAVKDSKTIKGFNAKGIKDVVLMNRSDKAKPYNVKPFKAWLADGRVVRKGQTSVNGLFHVSQTDPV